MNVIPGFCTMEEEIDIIKEISKMMRRKKYQYDHWDGVSCALAMKEQIWIL